MEQLIMNKYDISGIQIKDQGLATYINLTSYLNLDTGGRFSNYLSGKRNVNTIERLLNNLMRTEKWTGKKYSAYNVLKQAFEIIETKTKQNPIQILVAAIENSAPREEVTRLKYGGIAVPKSVDVSPSRRLDEALRNICRGAIKSSFKKKIHIQECLANEILLASRNDANSFAIGKKEEIERVAASAR